MNKLQGNRAYKEPDPNPLINGFEPEYLSSDHPITRSIRIEVYKGNKYQGKKIFTQGRIIIGSSLEADLVLSDTEIADKHACITYIDEQLVILDQTHKTGLQIKGGLYGISIIGLSEQVGLGPYILKISQQNEDIDNKSAQHAGSDSNLNNGKEGGQSEPPEHDQKVVDPFTKNEKPEVDLFSLFENAPVADHELYDLVFEGDIKDGLDIGKVKKNLSKILKSDESRVEYFLSRKRVVLKSGLEIDIAKKYKKFFEKSGAVCRLTAHKATETNELQVHEEVPEKVSTAISEQTSCKTVNEVKNEIIEEKPFIVKEEVVPSVEKSKSSDDAMIIHAQHFDSGKISEIQSQPAKQETIPKEEKSVWKFYGVEVDEEDDEDEVDLPADFYLKDKMDDLYASQSRHNSLDSKYLEIIKLSGRDVIDIKHLEERNKFYISDDKNKRFCLAEFKRANEALFSFTEALKGNLEIEGKPAVATGALMKDENRISKRKGIYRTRIPGKGKVIISDGYFDYQMRIVGRSLVPPAPEIKEPQKKSYKHIGVSFAFHIVFLTFLGLFPSFDSGNKMEDESRFVQLDTNQLAQLEQVVKPQPKPEPPAPAPVVEPKLKKQDKPKLVKKQRVMTASKKKPSKSKTTSKRSRHPDAGGGFGEGNVATRNINETGILGMISDSVGIQPRNALAAVTNLDAVSSPNVTSGNLKVGGVVGKLGTGEIAVPKGAIVATKGSSQVLRSYGRKGEGTVAALEKGKIGEQEVMGMVTATLDKSVRIRGGLSMEAVKRVIDEHLDDITYCYETELISNPSIVGKVMFEWKILMSGEVGEVRIKSSSINSHEIHTCIKDAIRTWKFPKPSGSEVLVSYPFVFDIVGF